MAFKAQEDHKGEHPGLHISQLDTELLAAEVVAIVHPKQSRQSLAKTHSNVRACCYCTAAAVCSQSTHARQAARPPTSVPSFFLNIHLFFCWPVYELRYEDTYSVARDHDDDMPYSRPLASVAAAAASVHE